MMIEEVQGKSFKATQSANPSTPDDAFKLLDRILVVIPPPPDWLLQKIKLPNTKVIAFGGDTCVFRLCALYFAGKRREEKEKMKKEKKESEDKEKKKKKEEEEEEEEKNEEEEKEKEEELLTFTPEMVREVLMAFTEKTDQQLAYLPQVSIGLLFFLLCCTLSSSYLLSSLLSQPEMAVPKLALVLGVMKRLGIREFHYCYANGCTAGVLVSVDLVESLV